MRLALYSGISDESQSQDSISQWADLPGLCCQAAGGQQYWADDLTLAWLLFYAAADVMDSVQDQDVPDAWWRQRGPGVALASATGIYFSASTVINNLHLQEETRGSANEIIRDFYQTLMGMTSGQYRELITPEPDLGQYWRFAEAKSGAFFSLACRNGARLATGEEQIIQAFSDFGQHLGLLIQILDDLDDIRLLQSPLPAGQFRKIQRSLPVAYAIEVSPPPQQERLHALLSSDYKGPASVEELASLLDQCGAALYVLTEIEKQRYLADGALRAAQAPADLAERLAAFVHNL